MPPGRQNIKASGELRHHHQNELNARNKKKWKKQQEETTQRKNDEDDEGIKKRNKNPRQFLYKSWKPAFLFCIFTSCIAKTIQEVFKA